ncbi:MAG: hypothetical protein QOG23_4610 [Blastocatellia bacterium]|jgi:hypothetical protein|nr:hypothetical protein [Blastocatellia bacterium]
MVLTLCRSGTVWLPLPLGEGRGEGLVRQARDNSPGFSPFSRRATSQFFNAIDACEEFLNGLRAEARSNVVVAVCAQALTPTLSQRERESNCSTTHLVDFLTK